MSDSPSEEILALLEGVRNGDPDARPRLIARLVEELRPHAHRLIRFERGGGCSLQTTDLLNETALRYLHGSGLEKIQDRNHLVAAGIRAMRNLLVDHARRRKLRRGPQLDCLDHLVDDCASRGEDLVDLDDCLESLAARGEVAARACQAFELSFFGGQQQREIAAFLGVSLRTVEKDLSWMRATLRAWVDGKRG